MKTEPQMRPMNRGGRPPGERGPKRAHLGLRAREALRIRLTQAAEAEGRSLSEEIEHRLERSFIEDELLGSANRLRLWARDVAALVHLIEAMTGRRAFGPDGDPLLFLMVREAFEVFFEAVNPPGDPGQAEGDARVSQAFHTFIALAAANVGEDSGLRGLVTQEDIDRARDLQQRISEHRPKGG